MRFILPAIIFMVIAIPVNAQEAGGVIRIVNQIQFDGNTLLSDEELMEVIPIEPGELLTTGELQSTVTAIEQAYRDRGYLAIVGDDILAGLEETGILTLPINEVQVSEIKIEGLVKTREDVVRRMLELQPGDLYSIHTLRRDADRLISLGIFESVDAALEPAEQPDEIIIIWRVQELEKTGYISLAGSYGARGNLVGSVTYTETNFRGRAERIRASGSIGSIAGRIGWELFYTNPWILRETSLALGAYSRVDYRFSRNLVTAPDTERYFERRNGGQVSFGRRLSDVRQLTLGIRHEGVNISNLPTAFFVPGVPTSDGRIISVPAEYVTDRRDYFIYPTQGTLLRAVVEPGRVALDDGDTSWIIKGTGELRWFRPLGQPSSGLPGGDEQRPPVLAARLMAGVSVGDLPFFEQFFLGGAYGLRGYLEDRFWGDQMVLASVEYRYPIGRTLTALAFVDAGDAWGSQFQFQPDAPTDFQQHESFSLQTGAGVGVRYLSPLGSLGLDFAWGEEFRVHLVFAEMP